MSKPFCVTIFGHSFVGNALEITGRTIINIENTMIMILSTMIWFACYSDGLLYRASCEVEVI